MSNITKLSNTNHITWSIQVRTLLEAHNLSCFIDNTTIVPSTTVLVDGISTENPAFAPWKQQDRMLFSNLLGTISVQLQPLVARAASVCQVWTTLADIYGKASRGHLLQLRDQIRKSVKGSQSIDDYFRFITTKSDELALLGKPMDHEDILEAILDGLPEEYKPIIDAVQARDTAIFVSELHEKLLNHDAKLLISASASSMSFPVSAHNTNSRPQHHHRFGPRPPYRSEPRSSPRQDHHSSPRGSLQYSRPRGYQGRCQACGIFGHSASRCTQFNLVAAQGILDGSSSWSPSPRPWQPRAHTAVHSSYDPDQWLLDSGASHHITTDLHNLAIHSPYSGGEDVVVGDGSGHSITHTGEGSQHGGANSARSK